MYFRKNTTTTYSAYPFISGGRFLQKNRLENRKSAGKKNHGLTADVMNLVFGEPVPLPKYHFERPLRAFCHTNLGEAKDQQ